ncbi:MULTISPECIES: alpha/beta hydrolase [unclassified Sphingopyxis]|uniref:alpha/beta hydrolase n=1 Tax=unclassified Sphingopyxis TaxID=2614943 RepID=UPI00285A0C64|nr:MULTISPECIES: alpha/beta hydrolase [unclassified Sphingopyxis]MDR6834333.1 acetyl esterase/lipase [Sphingopyxis sp. BE122]MDR7226602.1 acetyl esterase/lipase [Sphingopyxis sp. BE259]
MIKFLVFAVLLVLLFGGAAWMIVAGGAKSLNLGDRLLGDSDGATLQVAGQPYGTGTRNKLNIWVPTGTAKTDKLPVLVWLYGGGWYSGQRDDYGFAGRAFAKQGFIVVIPDYRLVPEGHWPDFLQDSAAAVAWTQKNIENYGGDPGRVALAGHSAGAYNSLMLALDPQWLKAAGSDVSVIRGVVSLAGPTDFYPFEKGGRADVAMGDIRPVEQTQPIAFVRADAPPLWLGHGTADTVVRVRNSQRLAAAMQKVGGSAALREYDGLSHNDLVMALTKPLAYKGPILPEMTDFLRGVTARPVAPAPIAE